MRLENYLTTREAATLLGVSIPTVQQWVERGKLKSWKTAGGHRRIPRGSVQELLDMRVAKAHASAAPYVMPVLVVEDDIHLTRLYRHQLEKWAFGVTVYVAPNGYEALVLAGEVQPRMMICDLRLPGVNGFHIVRGICAIQRFQEMGVVVVSGLPRAEIDAHGGLPERVEILSKPVDFAKLESIAKRLWDQAQDKPERVEPAQVQSALAGLGNVSAIASL